MSAPPTPDPCGRSRPGEGQTITIICADADAPDSCEPADHCCWGHAEDYAAGAQQWPIILKVRPDVTNRELVRHLLYVASVFDRRPPQ